MKRFLILRDTYYTNNTYSNDFSFLNLCQKFAREQGEIREKGCEIIENEVQFRDKLLFLTYKEYFCLFGWSLLF